MKFKVKELVICRTYKASVEAGEPVYFLAVVYLPGNVFTKVIPLANANDKDE